LTPPANRRDEPRAQAYIIDHLNPGQTIRRRVQVSNPSPTPSIVELYPAAATITNNTFSFADGRTPDELTSWITLDRHALAMAPGDRETILRACK